MSTLVRIGSLKFCLSHMGTGREHHSFAIDDELNINVHTITSCDLYIFNIMQLSFGCYVRVCNLSCAGEGIHVSHQNKQTHCSFWLIKPLSDYV